MKLVSKLGLCALLWLGAGPPVMAADFPATLDWSQRVELGTLVSGVVKVVKVRPGAHVAPGQVLLELDQRGFTASVKRAEARVARAKVEAAESDREFERAQELYDRTVLSDHDLKVAEIGAVRGRSALAEAEADLVQAKLDLERASLRATGRALVLAVYAVPGQAVITQLQSQPLLVLAASGRMRARAVIAPDDATGLRVGQAAQVEVAGSWIKATVDEPGLLSIDGRVRLVVSFAVPKGANLRAGQAARIRVAQ